MNIWSQKLPASLVVIILVLWTISICGWFFSGLILNVKRMEISTTPSEYGLKYENINIKRGNIELKAWFLTPPQKSNKTIILAHGWGTNRSDILPGKIFLLNRGGYNLLFFDFRNHGESGGAISSLGRYESEDIKAVIKYLKSNKAGYCKDIGLYGFSMGANASILAAAETSDIKSVVAESPFTYFDKTVERFAKIYYNMPRFPLVDLTLFFVKLRLGFDPQKYSSIKFIADVSPKPILLIYSENDTRAPLADGKILFEKAREPKDILVVPGADHGEAYLKAGLLYENTMLEFFKEAFNQ
jgi:uncharacterized protein